MSFKIQAFRGAKGFLKQSQLKMFLVIFLWDFKEFSITYAQFSNAVLTYSILSLCPSKSGIFVLVESLEQSHLVAYNINLIF